LQCHHNFVPVRLIVSHLKRHGARLVCIAVCSQIAWETVVPQRDAGCGSGGCGRKARRQWVLFRSSRHAKAELIVRRGSNTRALGLARLVYCPRTRSRFLYNRGAQQSCTNAGSFPPECLYVGWTSREYCARTLKAWVTIPRIGQRASRIIRSVVTSSLLLCPYVAVERTGTLHTASLHGTPGKSRDKQPSCSHRVALKSERCFELFRRSFLHPGDLQASRLRR